MIGAITRQSSLFYVNFGKQAELIKDDLLEPVDTLLDDTGMVELVHQSLAQRYPLSKRTGRTGIAPDRLLRSCVLKHIKGWSFRDLEREVRSNLLYRRFTRFDDAPIPDYSTFSRNLALLSPELTEKIHARVVGIAREEGVARGRKLRTDTTVVESNIHYPTDSSLIRDGIRVITRNLKRIAEACTEGALKVVDHRRTVKNRLIEIERASKSFTESSRTKFKDSYGKLMGITRGVVRQAETVMQALQAGTLPIMGSVLSVSRSQYELQHFLPLVKKVLAQTRARVFEGERHYPDKIVSIFEEHTAVIRKGKVSKPTEFGRLVRIDEVENGIVSHYDVADGNPADQPQWLPALNKHTEQFGQPPEMATADRGFFSADNERQAKKLGVKKVAVPARGRLAEKRARLQEQRWFRRALKWRGGIESRIATLKHRFAMLRATYKGDRGFKRYVGWCVISQNLISIARTKRKKEKDKQDARKNRLVE